MIGATKKTKNLFLSFSYPSKKPLASNAPQMMENTSVITRPVHSALFIYDISIYPMSSFRASSSLWTVKIRVSIIPRQVKPPNDPTLNSEYYPKYCTVFSGYFIEYAASIKFDIEKANSKR